MAETAPLSSPCKAHCARGLPGRGGPCRRPFTSGSASGDGSRQESTGCRQHRRRFRQGQRGQDQSSCRAKGSRVGSSALHPVPSRSQAGNARDDGSGSPRGRRIGSGDAGARLSQVASSQQERRFQNLKQFHNEARPEGL